MNNNLDKKLSGMIFKIQRHSLHDGPGVRTLVFLKGCYLKCIWCFNPESQSIKRDIVYFPERCIGCNSCIKACPKEAISIDLEKRKINLKKCDLCGSCIDVCPSEALKIYGYEITLEELMKEIEKDIVFYKRSNGGVTLSGGDPCFQWEFTINVLKECKRRRINTAVETTAYCDWQKFSKIAKFTDHILFDFKHMDSVQHKKLTGVDNKLILENATKLANSGKKITARVPIIPGFNDSEENLEKTAIFLNSLGNIIEVHLLPYLNIGISKYKRLGKEYLPEKLKSPTEREMESKKKIFHKFNLKVQIGG